MYSASICVWFGCRSWKVRFHLVFQHQSNWTIPCIGDHFCRGKICSRIVPMINIDFRGFTMLLETWFDPEHKIYGFSSLVWLKLTVKVTILLMDQLFTELNGINSKSMTLTPHWLHFVSCTSEIIRVNPSFLALPVGIELPCTENFVFSILYVILCCTFTD